MGLATKDRIVEEGQLHLADGSTVFAAEIHVIKEAIADASSALLSCASSQGSCRD